MVSKSDLIIFLTAAGFMLSHCSSEHPAASELYSESDSETSEECLDHFESIGSRLEQASNTNSFQTLFTEYESKVVKHKHDKNPTNRAGTCPRSPELDDAFTKALTINDVKGILTLKEDRPPQYVLVDTRSIEEFNVSHIEGAIHITDYQQSRAFPEAVLITYCTSGMRAFVTASDWAFKGKKVLIYPGVIAWAEAGQDFVDEEGELTYKVHTFNDNYMVPAPYQAIRVPSPYSSVSQ